MSETQKLKVEFDNPKHGWIAVALSSGEKEYKFFPSRVPYDSISELVSALLKVLDNYAEAKVRWNDEPVEHEFVFEVEGEKIKFRIDELFDSVVSRNRIERFSYQDSRFRVLQAFWKGLRDLQSKQSLEEYRKEWREPFPEREMIELTQRIKAMQLSGTV